MSKRGGLGRGLSALIPGAPEAGEGFAGLLEVPVNAVSPNPKQPRTHWDEEEIASLAASIREVGILQPIVVRKSGERYELVAGERRLRAAKVAGLATVPVVAAGHGRRRPPARSADREHPSRGPRPHRARRSVPSAPRGTRPQAGGARRAGRCVAVTHRQHDPVAAAAVGFPAAAHGRQDPGGSRTSACCPSATPRPSMPSPCGWQPKTSRCVRPRSSSAATWTGRPRRNRSRPPRPMPPPQVGMAEVEEILSEQLATRVQIQMNKKRGRVIIEFGSADDLERIVSEIVGSGPGLSPD